ncbi:MAG: hypothetical protein R2710_17745 [Acidimicrobiales bacterium]
MRSSTKSPEVTTHLEAENAYVDAMLGSTAELQQRIFDEIKQRVKETDLSVPVRKDGWSYDTRTVEGDQYAIHCRRPHRRRGRRSRGRRGRRADPAR